MILRRLGGAFVFASFLIAGCGKQLDFLHYLPNVPKQVFEGVHKLKELQGESQVDILWVVDDSGSMESYQRELARNANIFINDFVSKARLEWKMGLISSTIAKDPFVGFTSATQLNYQTNNNVDRFQRAVGTLETSGDSIEAFFTPSLRHLTASPDFLRSGATLAIIFLTDAPEQSQMSAATFLNGLKRLKGDLKKVVTYGVFASVDFGCVQVDENWNYKGSAYEAVISATHGKVFKLCNNDFGKNLAELGKDLVARVQHPFIALNDRPVISSVRVAYHGKDLPGGPEDQGGVWMYDFDLNRIVFHNLDFAPGDQEEVTIQYDSVAPLAK